MNVANKAIIRKLAFSQLKINHRRTIWTIIGIVLSTAMITAVYGFAVSGYATINAIKNVSTFRQEYLTTVGSISVVLSTVIIAASVIVISNAFRVSADERTRQFGLLKCVGTTKKQIIAIIMNEGVVLSLIAVPVGVIIGLLVQFGALQLANTILAGFNEAYRQGLSFHFVVAWQAILLSAVLAYITVMLSAWLPAQKAAKIPVVEAIRGTGEVNVNAKASLRANPVVELVFGVEGTLASKSFKRNGRSLRATVISLTISIIMFVAASSFGTQLGRMADLVFHLVDANVIGTFQSSVEAEHDENGSRILRYAAISQENAETVTARLRSFPETTVFGVGENNHSYSTAIPLGMMTQELQGIALQYLSMDEMSEEVEGSVSLLTVDDVNYAELCSLAGVPIGSNILINYSRQYINEKWTEITPYVFSGQTLSIRNGDDDSTPVFTDIPLHGVLGREAPNEVLWFTGSSLTVLVPNLDSIRYAWFAESSDPFAFEEHMYAVFDDRISHEGKIPIDTFISNGVAQENAQRSVYRLFMLFLYGFVAMLTLIGLTNVISTISTNVRLRSREFAVLRSIGMTHGGLYRMLNLESVLCSAKSLAIGLPIGIGVSYGIYRSILASVEFPFVFPWLPVVQCVVAVFAVTWVIMRYSAAKLRGGSIVEAIRLESGN
jgi:putative ABC transport system permease protein